MAPPGSFVASQARKWGAPGKDLVAGLVIRGLRRFFPRPDSAPSFLGQWGRLGNQLFQIAGTYALASDLGVRVVLRNDWPYRRYFALPD